MPSVLIETLWNVKYYITLGISNRLKGINRNIVECKETSQDRRCKKGNCINRNIVECKDGMPTALNIYNLVLIETLWNVKLFTNGIMKRIAFRINRNIVECKVTFSLNLPACCNCINRNIVECKAETAMVLGELYRVLIETLWNVKEIKISTKKPSKSTY